MKKLILNAAALMIGAVAFAQVTGAPTAQTVAQLPGSAATANAGESIQNGNANKVQVRQAGELNSVYTIQDDGALSGGNLGRVQQQGNVNGNQADSGEANAAELRQSGELNQSTIRQEGDRNNAYSAQGQNDGDNSSGNKSRIQQGIGNQAEDNFAAIVQDGVDNQASTLQIIDNGDAFTTQLGTENKSRIVQNAAPENSDGHEALVGQDGDRNESSINQSGAGARNTARTFQQGDDNKAKQVQTTDAVAGGSGNTAIIAQGNDATGFGFSSLLIDLDTVDDVTGGPANVDSFGGIAFQTQAGSDNSADIRQFGDDDPSGNYAEQNQGGTSNEAFIVQNRRGVSSGAANYARQDQDDNATNSEAGLSQRGANHKSYQRQTGDSNSSLVSQRGNGEGNIAHTFQSGDMNAVTLAQRRENNAASIVQRDGQSFVGQQNLNAIGGGNQIDALQLGPDGNFHTDGVDCIIPEPMDPMSISDVPGFSLEDICPGC